MAMKHRTLVVGVGSIGERHTRCFLATGRAEVAICETNDAGREAVASRLPVAAKFRSLEEGLAWKPDSVVICTPAQLHVAMARAAIAAGADVLLEKPVSTTLDGIAELDREANVAGKRIVVAYVYRSHPAIVAMRDAIAGGRFGEPLEAIVVSGQHFPFYRPAYRSIYYVDRKTGGGATQDALTHLVNAVEWLVGPTTRVAADMAHLALEGVTVEDTVHMLARNRSPAGEVLANYSLNQHQAPNETTITIVCRRGALRFETPKNHWRWCVEPGAGWTDEPVGPLERDDLFIRQANAFLDVLEGKSPSFCTLNDGTQTLRAILAALRSNETGGWETT